MVSDHAVEPTASPTGTLGLWYSRLRAGDGGPIDAGLALLPIRPEPDDPGIDTSPLSAGERESIAAGNAGVPHVRRLELSALGGSFSARALAPNAEWDHDATLARDQRVRVLSKGVLYPFGHRAEFQRLTERTLMPVEGPAVAGLQIEQLLTVTEPLKSMAADDPALARQFPFSEVEILLRSVTELAPVCWSQHPLEPLPSDDLQQELHELRVQLQQDEDQLNSEIAALPTDLSTYMDQGFGVSPQLAELQQQAADVGDPDAMIAEKRGIGSSDRPAGGSAHAPIPPPRRLRSFRPKSQGSSSPART